MATPISLPSNTRTQQVEWKSLVEEHEDLRKPHPTYQFKRRRFFETDNDGIYNSAKPN